VTLLADLLPGPGSSQPQSMTVVGRSLYFSAISPSHGREPWVSDGTAQTTRIVGDIAPGPSSSTLRHVTSTAHGALLTFSTGDSGHGSYWTTTTTGAAAGDLTLLWRTPLRSTSAVRFGDDALIAGSDFNDNVVLWRTDGTPGSPLELRTGLTLGDDLTEAGDKVFFTDAQNPLMVTDGTAAGTRRLRGWPDGPHGSSFAYGLKGLDGRAYFGVETLFKIGTELWGSDGTRSGTRLIKDINPGSASSNPRKFTVFHDSMYFVARDRRHGRQVWHTDGSAAGTKRVTNLPRLTGMVLCDDSLLFASYDGRRSTLWRSNGTPTGLQAITTLRGTPESIPRHLTCTTGGLVFTRKDALHGNEVWTMPDGSVHPVVHDIRPGPRGSNPGSLLGVGDNVVLVANDGQHGREFWTAAFR
jgi:ELWxxDGT repeat protein